MRSNELGADIEIGGTLRVTHGEARGTHLFLEEASVMGTENTIMAAVLAEGEK